MSATSSSLDSKRARTDVAVMDHAPETDSDESGLSSWSEPDTDTNSDMSDMSVGSERSDVDHLACGKDAVHTPLDVAFQAASALSARLLEDPTLPPPFDPSDHADNISEVMDGLQ